MGAAGGVAKLDGERLPNIYPVPHMESIVSRKPDFPGGPDIPVSDPFPYDRIIRWRKSVR
jgi:hypothetical protein